jgi:hypothetical protein
MLKKILIAALLLPLLAFGQSYPSPTFNNLTVQGTFTASGKVGLASLAAQAANTVVANVTASSASPTAVALPSCSTANSALQYTSGTGLSCGTAFALTGGTLAQFAATTSAQLAGVISDETGTGALVFGTSPTIGTATINTPTISGGSINNTPIGATTANTGAFTTLGASANDALLYQTTNAQSFTSGSAATVTTWTKVFDRVNANFNAATGVFTAPATGMYFVSAALAFAANTGAINTRGQINIVANGVTVAIGVYTRQTATSTECTPQVSALVSLTAGQTIVIQGVQNTGGAVALDGGATFNYVSINRVP